MQQDFPKNPLIFFQTKWKNWQYKNTTLLILSLVLFAYFAESPQVTAFIKAIGAFGYFGAFLAGVAFVSIFTVVPAAAILFELAHNLHPYYVALVAGAGAVLGDFLIFKYLRDQVFEELLPLFKRFSNQKLMLIFKTPFFSFLIPLLGLLIIASPFPDEIGIALLSTSKIKRWQFLLLTLFLNSVGILAVIMLSRLI